MMKRLLIGFLSGVLALSIPFGAFAQDVAVPLPSEPPSGSVSLSAEEKAALEAKYKAMKEEHKEFGQDVKELRQDFNEVKKQYHEQYKDGVLSQEEMKNKIEAERARVEAEMKAALAKKNALNGEMKALREQLQGEPSAVPPQTPTSSGKHEKKMKEFMHKMKKSFPSPAKKRTVGPLGGFVGEVTEKGFFLKEGNSARFVEVTDRTVLVALAEEGAKVISLASLQAGGRVHVMVRKNPSDPKQLTALLVVQMNFEEEAPPAPPAESAPAAESPPPTEPVPAQ